jgi:hypothetical protein
MQTHGELLIDPPSIDTGGQCGAIEIVVPFTEWAVAEAVMKRATAFTARLNASLMLVAVHAVPYPMSFGCPALVHAHLVDQLIDLASRCPLPVNPQVVLARSCQEGFRHALKPASTVLLGTRKRLWKTSEERLATALAQDGHHVALVHVE